MVILAEDWELLKNTSNKQGYYQVLSIDGAVEAHLAIGKLGFKKQCDNNTDPHSARELTDERDSSYSILD